MGSFLVALTGTRSAVLVLIAAMLLVYAAEPIFVYQIVPDEQFLALTRLSLVSCISICVGYALPMLIGTVVAAASVVVALLLSPETKGKVLVSELSVA